MEISKGKKIVDLKSRISPSQAKAILAPKNMPLLPIQETVSLPTTDREEKEPEKLMTRKEKGDQIAELYSQSEEEGKNWNIFEQASHLIEPEKLKIIIRWSAIGFGVLLIIVFSWIMLTRKSKDKVVQDQWYAVKLVNGERYFGRVENVTSDPMILSHSYSTINNGDDNQAGNMQLVKRVKESYGPTGTMNIFRNQIIYLEPLQSDSRVLQAILDYEK